MVSCYGASCGDSGWERQMAGDAAADAMRQDKTACSHDLLQPSDGLTPIDRTVSDGRPPQWSRPQTTWVV